MPTPPTTNPSGPEPTGPQPPWLPLDLRGLGSARESLARAALALAQSFADSTRRIPEVAPYAAWIADVLREDADAHLDDDVGLAERRVRLANEHRRNGLSGLDALTALVALQSDYVATSVAATEAVHPEALHVIGALLAREASVLRWAEQQHATRSADTQARLANVGLLAGNIGHELRNPLGVIESSAFLLRRKGPTDPAFVRHLDKISRQVSASRQIIDDLLALARNSPPRCESLSPQTAVEHAMEAAALASDFRVRLDLDADARVDADPGLLQRVLVNVFQNAAHAMRGGGVIDISAVTDPRGTTVIIQDDGPGFPDALLETLFEPLVTGDQQGTGLGLALVQSVLERHGGRASARNRPEGGARIELRFPHAR